MDKAIANSILKRISLLDAYVNMLMGIYEISYDIIFPTFIHAIYHKDKVCYFSNRNVISIMKEDMGEVIN